MSTSFNVPVPPCDERVALVNPLCGSDSESIFSTGLTYPAVGRPWGMTHWSPRNRPNSRMFSRRRSWPVNTFQGFAATHAPSPWMGDYGSFTLFPFVGDVPDPSDFRFNSYRLDGETSRPDYYACTLQSPAIHCELTSTARCGLMRFTFQKGSPTIVLQLTSAKCEVKQDGNRLLVTARDGHVPDGYAGYAVIEFDRAITGTHDLPASKDDGPPSHAGGTAIACSFDESTGPINVRIGTSFICHDQAERNLAGEVGDASFDDIQQAANEHWAKELGRIRVTGGTHEQQRILYSGIYRALLFPRTLDERNEDGETIHFSPYTIKLEYGTLVCDHGFWDTSRSVYTLFSLAWRKEYGRLVDGWLRCFTQSGWMPQWASPGHRSCMVGTHSAAMICEGITKGIEGFDYQVGLDSMLNDATNPGDPDGKYGRQQLKEYLELGYCPEVENDGDSVCRTLDYSYNDWCCARAAEVLGDKKAAEKYFERAQNYRKLWHDGSKFFRPKNADGSWHEPWDEFRWGGPYREGSAWQYRFSVPHDAEGLAELFGGADALADGLQAMVDTPPHFGIGTYGRPIHEMLEMAGATLGQYAQSNQPVHQALWTAAGVGRGDITDKLVRRTLEETYSVDAWPGDEDNGEMGSWYVLAAIGLFPHCPGDDVYTTTKPLFDTIELHGDDGVVIKYDAETIAKHRHVKHADLMQMR